MGRSVGTLLLVLVACSSGAGTDSTPFDVTLQTKRAIAASVCDGREVSLFRGWTSWSEASKTTAYLSAVTKCQATASTCEAFLACEGVDANRPCLETTPGKCLDQRTSEYCEERISTMDLWSVAFMRRDACADMWDENTLCSFDIVEDPAAELLDACVSGTCSAGPDRGCDGSVFWRCSGGGKDADDCSVLDMTCTLTGCASRTSDPARATCLDDHTMEVSGKGTPTWRLDCTNLDPTFTCQPNVEMPKNSCRADPNTTECEDDDARCQGDVAQVCVGGTWFSFDCSTFLDATCREKAYGGDEKYAYCFSQAWYELMTAAGGVR